MAYVDLPTVEIATGYRPSLRKGSPDHLMLAVRPKWEGEIAQRLGLSAEQKKAFNKLLAIELESAFSYNIRDVAGKQHGLERIDKVHISLDRQGNMLLTQAIKPKTKNYSREEIAADVERKSAIWMDWATMAYEKQMKALVKETLAFDNIKDFFDAYEPMAQMPESYSGRHPELHKMAQNKEELEEITQFLADKGVKNVRLLTSAGASMLFETDGNSVVRISSVKDTREEDIQIPHMLQPYVTQKFADVYVDIMPKIKGQTISHKSSPTPETERLKKVLLFGFELDGEHYDFHEAHGRNVMLLDDGTPIIVDLGAVRRIPDAHKPKAEDIAHIVHADITPHRWLDEDGIPKQHKQFPTLALKGEARLEALRASFAGGYEVPVQPVDDWLAQERSAIKFETLQKIDAAQTHTAHLDVERYFAVEKSKELQKQGKAGVVMG